MTATLEVTFPWGLYHATPWGRDANEGVVEWPPSPWRILRALYATWRGRVPGIEAGVVERLLSQLTEPPAYLLPPFIEAHTRHYMPDVTHMRDRPKWAADSKYSGDAVDKVLDAFVVTERDAAAVIQWPCDLAAEERAALAGLAAELPYLGRAESICSARLLEKVEETSLSADPSAWLAPLTQPASANLGTPRSAYVRVLAPARPLDVTRLTASTTDVRSARFTVPPGSCWIEYPSPVASKPKTPARVRSHHHPIALRWAYITPARPSIRATVAVGDVLREACMSRYGHRFDHGVSPTLSGKDSDGNRLTGHRHAHYLALDTDGDRMIDHLVLWAPDGLKSKELQALLDLECLRDRGWVSDFRPGRLGLEALGAIRDVAPEITGPARTWKSVTPFAPPHHAHKREVWEDHVVKQVAEELHRRSLPTPQSVRLLTGDWLSFRRHRVKERLEDQRRAWGVTISFAEDVSGPLTLGSLSHFGLGLFRPFVDPDA